MLIRVEGVFCRSISAGHRDRVLDGSVRPGRYSRISEPSLYLSSSREGVEAAMTAHTQDGDPERVILPLRVVADRIFDLRDPEACAEAGIDRDRAVADWQDIVKAGGEAPSWQVADVIRSLGANGLIDPSRQVPGLWHLVLFRWNEPGGAEVRLIANGEGAL